MSQKLLKKISYSDLKSNPDGIQTYLNIHSEEEEIVTEIVKEIITKVRNNGDKAIIEYEKKFDGVDLNKDGKKSIKVSEEMIENAYDYVSDELVTALNKAISNIKKFHSAQIIKPWSIQTVEGVKAGQVLRPIESVGIYIPGGRAIYPSSVLMTSIPALVAGVDRVVICSPPKKYNIDNKEYIGIHPAIIVAAAECGVSEIYQVGGAQAIAAMAFGTETIPNVVKIIGPGNKYVNKAKILVSDQVSIDTPAGPSEVGILADETSNPTYVAYDLLSQVEHDPDNVGVVVSHIASFYDDLENSLNKIIENAPRKNIMKQSLKKNGLFILTDNIEQSIATINDFAPEHLEILTREPTLVLAKIKNAGAIFLGEYSPVPLGDYAAGTNHVLPTGGGAKIYSGLNTLSFMKVIDTLECSKKGLETLEKILTPIAEYEGLFGHRDAVQARLKK